MGRIAKLLMRVDYLTGTIIRVPPNNFALTLSTTVSNCTDQWQI
jgi:hypothetical protein